MKNFESNFEKIQMAAYIMERIFNRSYKYANNLRLRSNRFGGYDEPDTNDVAGLIKWCRSVINNELDTIEGK